MMTVLCVTGVLPEAEAHGAGQDARQVARSTRRADTPANRGSQSRGRSAAGRDGERLSHQLRSQVPR